jgi:hypothetical protein
MDWDVVRKRAEWRIDMGFVTNNGDCEGTEAHDNKCCFKVQHSHLYS